MSQIVKAAYGEKRSDAKYLCMPSVPPPGDSFS